MKYVSGRSHPVISCCFTGFYFVLRSTGKMLFVLHKVFGCSTSSSHWKMWPHEHIASLVSSSSHASMVYPPPYPSLSNLALSLHSLPFPSSLFYPPTPPPPPHPPPRSCCKLRGPSSLKALTPVALIAAAVAPTLAAWMAMNISSGGEEERRVSGGGRGRLGRGAEQVRTEEAHAWTSGMGMGRGRRGGR